MKPIPIVNRKSPIANGWAFTLVELLTVIATIAILAALLMPVLSTARIHAQKTQARLQMSDLVTAIQNYDSAYSRMPIPAVERQAAVGPAQQALGLAGNFTFGGTFQTPVGPTSIGTPVPANNTVSNNSDVIAILMDLTNYPGTNALTVNVNHQKNPQQTIFLNAKLVAYPNLPGVGPDLVYRDPWRNPYIITMDLNDDNRCMDAFYCRQAASQQDNQAGFNELNNSADPAGVGDHFAYHGNVMVWSAGPDGRVDLTKNAINGVNQDNVLSWQ